MERNLLKQIITFGIVGGIATVIDFIFFNLIFLMTSLFVYSRVIGIFMSMIWNFMMNRTVTFKAQEGKIKGQLVKYLIVYGISMGSNVLVSWFVYVYMLSPGQLNANIAAVFALCVSIPLAFIGSKLWAFKTSKRIKEEEPLV